MNISFCAITKRDFRFIDEVNYGRSLWFVQRGFSPQCLCTSEKCNNAERNPYAIELNFIIRKLFYIEYVLGAIAIVLNLIVTLTIILSRPLYKPSFIMICNVALCDILIGIYSVLTGRFTVYEFIVNHKNYGDMDVFVNPYCTALGFIFTTAQMVAVPTTLLMTIERFLSIVYCMDPSRRVRKRLTLILIALFWLGGMCYAFLPVFRVGGLRQHGEYTCTLPFVDGEDETHVNKSTLVIAILLAVLYLSGSCLYIPIYRYVKRTNVSAGVKRKATLAKNIAIMITTNFVFFLLPLISILIFAYGYKSLVEILQVNTRTLKHLQIYLICISWLPVVLLAVNSCLNPFLCAFRHPKFRSQLMLLLGKLRKLNNSVSAALWNGDRTPAGGDISMSDSNVVEKNAADTAELGIRNDTFRISSECLTQL